MHEPIEFRGLRRQYRALQERVNQAVQQVMQTGGFIGGEPVEELERQLAADAGRRACITCANGTDALRLVLLAWGIGPGDAVFVPDFTFFATAEAVLQVGAQPILVDVEPDTGLLDAHCLEAAICREKQAGMLRPRVVIPVDLFGVPMDDVAIGAVAKRHGLLVLEDAAQGYGGARDGRHACGFGDASITSFFPAKPLGCYGDGGAIFTDDTATEALLHSLRAHGMGAHKYEHLRMGFNSRLDTIQAAILLVKREAFWANELEQIHCVAQWYDARLREVVALPVVPPGCRSAWAQYVVRFTCSEQRDQVKARLEACGIPTMIYYPTPLHRQPVFQEMWGEAFFPGAEALCKSVLALPIHPYLTEPEVHLITHTICEEGGEAPTGDPGGL